MADEITWNIAILRSYVERPMTIFSSTDFEFLSCLYTYQVTQNISGSPIERQWGSRRYPGWLDRHVLTLSEIRSCDTIAYRMYLVSRLYTEAFSKWPPIWRRHFQMHLLAQKCCLLIHPSLNFVSTWLVTSKTALAQIMTWHRRGGKQLSGSMVALFVWRIHASLGLDELT